jgi:hypothetical protein
MGSFTRFGARHRSDGVNDSADTCKRSFKGCATASRFSILECRRWGESARIIRSSRKPPFAGDKIRGNPNGGLGR